MQSEVLRATQVPKPAYLSTRREVLSHPCPVPAGPGVYGWWFRRLPASIDVSGCLSSDGFTLLHVGISPKRPPLKGRPPSHQTLRDRVVADYTADAAGSSLRKTLGCLLAAELGIELRRVGSRDRLTFAGGESTLSAWMAENALVSWVAIGRPWELEDAVFARLDLPLNLDGRADDPFSPTLRRTREAAVRRARVLPIVAHHGR